METDAALLEKSVLRITAANILPILAAALLCAWAIPGHAGQSTGQFPVTINLQNSSASAPGAAPNTALCRSGTMVGAFGSSVTVVCSTGAVVSSAGTGASNLPWTTMPDNTYRFMFSAYRDGDQYRTVDNYSGAGTIASWRRIKLNDRDYLEMMLHW